MESERFIRQEFLSEIAPDAQKKLNESRVLVLGAGGLGSPVLLYLAGAGVGAVSVVDRDFVALSNLNRQILYTPEMIGKPKATLAADYIKSFNPDGLISPYVAEISPELLDILLLEHDLVFDCCDNHATRMMIAKSCKKHNKTCIVTGINRLEGFTFVSIPGKTACYGCLYGARKPKTSAMPQVLGANAGVFGSLAAASGILHLLGHGSEENMVVADLFQMSFSKVDIERDEECPVCSKHC